MKRTFFFLPFPGLFRLVGGLLGIGLLALALIISTVRYSSTQYEYTDPSQIPAQRVGIVFGAQVRPDLSLSPILQDRVEGGIRLYQNKRIEKILMSGDNGQVDYNEVVAMQKYAVARGIPERDIVLDYAGFSTYDSCYRAQQIFRLEKAILITQQYHLHRALYTCRTLGIEAYGYALPDFDKYPDLRIRYTLREFGADAKAWWELHLTHPLPTFLGKVEEIL